MNLTAAITPSPLPPVAGAADPATAAAAVASAGALQVSVQVAARFATTPELLRPQLDAPETPAPNSGDFDFSDNIALLKLNVAVTDNQIMSAQNHLRATGDRQRNAHEEVQRKLAEAIKEAKKAENASFWDKLFGWLTKIFSIIAAALTVAVAAVASVASGGAASPLLVMATAALVTMVGDTLVEMCGGPPNFFSNLLNNTLSKLCQAFGASQELADKIANITVGVIAAAAAIACPATLLLTAQLIGKAAASLGEALGMDKQAAAWLGLGVSLACMAVSVGTAGAALASTTRGAAGTAKLSQTAGMFQKYGGITSGVANVTAGTSGAAGGATHIYVETKKADAAIATGEAERFKAIVKLLGKLLEDERDNFKALYEMRTKLVSIAVDINRSSDDSRREIVGHLV